MIRLRFYAKELLKLKVMANYKTQQPYIASYVIFRKGNKIAFVLRQNTGWMDAHFGLPSGKVEQDESYATCAIREAKEEVGVTIQRADLEYVHTMHRYEVNENNWVDVFFEAKKWQGELHNAEPSKASEFMWLDPKNLPDNIVPNVRYAIEQIENNSPFSEYNWEQL